MNTTFMNSGDSKTSRPRTFLFNLFDETNLRRNDQDVALSSFTIQGKYKNFMQKTNLKYQLRHKMKSLNYLMDHILYQVFKISLNLSYKITE